MMSQQQQRHNETFRQHISPPIDFNRSAVDVRTLLGGGMRGVGLIAGGTLLFSLAAVAPWAWLAVPLVVLAGGSLVFGGLVAWSVVSEQNDYRQRRAEWHTAMIDQYIEDRVPEQEIEVQGDVLDPENPLHLIALAFEIHRRELNGESRSVKALARARGLFVKDQGSYRRVCSMTHDTVQRSMNELARRGLFEGRMHREEGAWLPVTETEIIGMLERKER
jgi:hypothetical protein